MISLRRVLRPLFSRISVHTDRNIRDTLRSETTGGVLLLVGALAALVWANSPWQESYGMLREITVGPEAFHLNLSLSAWATDGLLAVFFFVVGLELKREFVCGDLRRPATAIVPMVAAVGGMIAPALIYVSINFAMSGGDLAGWAVPTATDIAFTVAVLAIVSTHLPRALRAFILTLAVVDDLLAIIVIAAFYSSDLQWVWLVVSFAAIALFGFFVQRRITPWWLMTPIAFAAWAAMHASGVHATIAGVLLAFTVPAIARTGEDQSLAETLEHRFRPWSASLAVPLFALCSAGVTFSSEMLTAAVSDPVAIGVAAGLVLGKPLGILTATFLVARFTRAALAPGLRWLDVLGVSALAGIGFTVSLLIGELAFGEGSPHDDHLKVAIVAGSLISALVGGIILKLRNRQYRALAPTEIADGE